VNINFSKELLKRTFGCRMTGVSSLLSELRESFILSLSGRAGESFGAASISILAAFFTRRIPAAQVFPERLLWITENLTISPTPRSAIETSMRLVAWKKTFLLKRKR